MDPIGLKYVRVDLYTVEVFGVYYNSLHLERMGKVSIDDIPEDEVPTLNEKEVILR